MNWKSKIKYLYRNFLSHKLSELKCVYSAGSVMKNLQQWRPQRRRYSCEWEKTNLGYCRLMQQLISTLWLLHNQIACGHPIVLPHNAKRPIVYIKVILPSPSLALFHLFCSFFSSLFLSLVLSRFSILCVLFALYVSGAFLLGCFLIYVEYACAHTHTHTHCTYFLYYSYIGVVFYSFFFTIFCRVHIVCFVGCSLCIRRE